LPSTLFSHATKHLSDIDADESRISNTSVLHTSIAPNIPVPARAPQFVLLKVFSYSDWSMDMPFPTEQKETATNRSTQRPVPLQFRMRYHLSIGTVVCELSFVSATASSRFHKVSAWPPSPQSSYASTGYQFQYWVSKKYEEPQQLTNQDEPTVEMRQCLNQRHRVHCHPSSEPVMPITQLKRRSDLVNISSLL
jgi:hypothetical protein